VNASPSAAVAAAVFATAPVALGGARLRARAGPARDAWLAAVRTALPADHPWSRLPSHADDAALLGGLDLAATLSAGHAVRSRGLLARSAGGVLVAAMAERIASGTAARLCAALDDADPDARCALIALDEGDLERDEAPPASLLDRLALHVEPADTDDWALDVDAIAWARSHWRAVALGDAAIEALVATADALGVASLRAPLQAATVARIVAALDGHDTVDDAALATAARLVLAPRATRLPPAEAAPESEPPPPPPETDAPPDTDADDANASDTPLEDRVLDAARAAIPPGLLALLLAGRERGARSGDAGRSGQSTASKARGRVIGSARGDPRDGARLALIDTLRAAAPWQRLRRGAHPGSGASAARVHVSRDDLRVQRRVEHRATTTIFAIDASGSQAVHRLAEAKGAVESLLADCYARRDRVAVIGFRGTRADVLLAPTRSLVRARRQLAGLPGGGGTPLASGIAAAHAMSAAARRAGTTPLVVLVTDARANIARDGTPGREAAQRDAQRAARVFAGDRTRALLIDTSPQPSALAAQLATTLGARYVALPYAAADAVSATVRQVRDHG
jgi:magnesium chelatase subunit D